MHPRHSNMKADHIMSCRYYYLSKLTTARVCTYDLLYELETTEYANLVLDGEDRGLWRENENLNFIDNYR